VKDCAAGIQLVHMARRLTHRVYNVGAGRATTNGELLAAVNRTGPGPHFSLPADAEAPGARNAYMDISLIREDTGYEPEYDVESGVADYVEWLQLNPQ
jgi:UDP-glucose 4-epimerase